MSKHNRHPKKLKGEATKNVPMVPAVKQALTILNSLANSSEPKLRLTDVCNRAGIHRSKGYSILSTLRNFGYVVKDSVAKTYSLGPALIYLSEKTLDTIDYRETVKPFLEKLVAETNCTAVFGLIDDDYFLVVAKSERHHEITMTIRLGSRFPVTYGAHGKAIVAFLPRGESEKIVAKKRLYFHREFSRKNMGWLTEELSKCRKLGFAKDLGEMNPGINAVAAPVFGPRGKLIGSMFIVGTFVRNLADQYGHKLATYAREVSSLLGTEVEKIYTKGGKEKEKRL